jgi:hypothetical protein
MIRFYSLFISDDNLLASPYSQKFNFFHDVSLRRGVEETVNFLLQTVLSTEQENNLNVIFDPLSLNILNVEVKSFKKQTIVAISLIPNEVGSVKIGIALPQSTSLHEEKINNLPSPLVSMKYKTIKQKSDASVRPVATTAVY